MQCVFRKPFWIVAIPVLWRQVEGAFAHIAYSVTVLRFFFGNISRVAGKNTEFYNGIVVYKIMFKNISNNFQS